MKTLFFALFLTATTSAHAQWMTAVTDLTNDCIVVSSATEEAPIDFYTAECKSFGGFKLEISGSDLRYGPTLDFHGSKIDLKRPFRFHDLAGDKIEWLYTLEKNNEGVGKLAWKGMVYPLNVATDDGEKDTVAWYSVYLNGEKSCVLGVAKTNEEAREMIYKSNGVCSYQGEIID